MKAITRLPRNKRRFERLPKEVLPTMKTIRILPRHAARYFALLFLQTILSGLRQANAGIHPP
jgi:hypothetical protein